MNIFAKLFGKQTEHIELTNTEHVKRIVRSAQGASDFVRRATEFGFKPDGGSATSSHYRKDGCLFSITVYRPYGADRIFCLVVNERDVTDGSVCLVDEGVLKI